MKKIFLAIAAAIALSCMSTQLHAIAKINFENSYGAPIVLAFKVPGGTKIQDDQTLDNRTTLTLGTLASMKEHTRRGTEFYARATGMTSRYTSLQPYINQILAEDNPNKSKTVAVITVNPSYVGWNITVGYKDY